MKNTENRPKIESRTFTLALGLALGLGIVMHKVFFLVGAAVAMAAAGEGMLHAARTGLTTAKLVHRHP